MHNIQGIQGIHKYDSKNLGWYGRGELVPQYFAFQPFLTSLVMEKTVFCVIR